MPKIAVCKCGNAHWADKKCTQCTKKSHYEIIKEAFDKCGVHYLDRFLGEINNGHIKELVVTSPTIQFNENGNLIPF